MNTMVQNVVNPFIDEKLELSNYKVRFRNNVYHRGYGPAVEYNEWYRNGLLHREDSQVVECANGDKE